ncbi:MAG: hypothetical protein WC421_03530 [Elusimicrobiales bacterium]
MPLPNNIQNGDIPDADVLMADLNYLADGKGIRVADYGMLKSFAAGAPGQPFLCIASDLKQLMAYMGDANVGDGGFIAIGGAPATTTEVG